MEMTALVFQGSNFEITEMFNKIKKTPAAKMKLIEFAVLCEYNCGCCDTASECSHIGEPIIASNMTIGMNGGDLRQFVNFKLDEYFEHKEHENHH